MNVLDLYASLSLNTENYDNGLSNARNAANAFGEEIVDALESGVQAYIELISDSIKAYSDYEETADGIRRIFDDSADSIIANSKNAYKNAQISSSEYLANAQVLSGALLRTMADDTEGAVALIDMAMTDLSDNVNAMGSDMNFVMKAYAGFARQEFRMLDNLYLGYGGTKTEARNMLYAMAEEKELLEQLGIEFKNLPETYDKMDFSMLTLDNIIKAIHVRQVQMNVAGTTLEEGATHIQGTVRKTQAAWKDLLKTFAGETDMSLDEAIEHVYESVFGEKEGEGLLNVIVPRISQAMEGISNFIVKSAPILAKTIPEVIETLRPSLESAIDSIGTLITTILPSVIDLLWPVISDVMSTLLDSITKKMHESGGIFDLIANIVDFVRAHADDLPGILTAMWGSITSLKIAQDIMEFITLLRSMFNRATLIVGVIGAIGGLLLLYRGELTQFFSQIGNFFDLLSLQFENIELIFGNIDLVALGMRIGTNLLIGIANGINAGIGMIQDAINNIIGEINAGFGGVLNFFGIDEIGEIELPKISTEGLEASLGEDKRLLNASVLNANGHGEYVRALLDERNAEMDEIQQELRTGSYWNVGDNRSLGKRAIDTFGEATNLLGFNTGLFKDLGIDESVGGLFGLKLPEPVPAEATESVNDYTEAVQGAVNAISGSNGEDTSGLVTSVQAVGDKFVETASSAEPLVSELSEELPAAASALVSAIAGVEDSDTTSLNTAIEGTASAMNGIVDEVAPIVSAFTEELPAAATTLVNALAGESEEGGQTLSGALESIGSFFKAIYDNTKNVITTWNGSLAEAIGKLKTKAEIAVSAVNDMSGAADAAVGSYDALRSSIDNVILSIEKLSGMEIQIPVTGRDSTGFTLPNIPGRASGGSVTANNPYWVGEEGIELYVPNRTGTIVSNDALSRLGQQIVNIYVNFEGEVIGDEDSISGYVTRACKNAMKEAINAGS